MSTPDVPKTTEREAYLVQRYSDAGEDYTPVRIYLERSAAEAFVDATNAESAEREGPWHEWCDARWVLVGHLYRQNIFVSDEEVQPLIAHLGPCPPAPQGEMSVDPVPLYESDA